MHIRPLSKELQEVAIRELNENPNRIQDDLESMREWAKQKPHIKIRPEDQWLLTFLRGCAFDLELAKEKLDLFFTIKPLTPEFFSNRDPFLPEIQELLKLGVCLPLPKLKDPAAPRIVLCRIEHVDPTKIRIETGMKLAAMVIDILLNEDDNCIISGGHLFIDNKGVTIKHILQVTPRIIKKTFRCFIDAYAARPKGCHIINAPRIAHIAFNMFKPLFHSKLLDMLHFYTENSKDKLYESVPLSVLPIEYGGDGGTLEELTNQWKEKVESYRDWFLEDERYYSQKAGCSEGSEGDEDFFDCEEFVNKLEFD